MGCYLAESTSAVAVADESVLNAEFVDAFPSKVFDLAEIDEVNQVLASAFRMDTISDYSADAIPVIPCKWETSDENDDNRFYQRVVFYNLINDRALLTDRFERLFEEARCRLPRTGYEDVNWVSMEKKMLKAPRVAHRYNRNKINKINGNQRKGNADNRQSFVYKHQHLVKSRLTNGLRTTQAYDFYIVYAVPIMIYRLKRNVVAPPPEGTFYANMKSSFEGFILNPISPNYTIYVVHPGTTYLTVSLQKTCYAILRTTESLFLQLNAMMEIYSAFDPANAFTPKSDAELEALTRSNTLKKKRGRPAKSLDALYWYKPSAYTATPTDITKNPPQLTGDSFRSPPSASTTDNVQKTQTEPQPQRKQPSPKKKIHLSDIFPDFPLSPPNDIRLSQEVDDIVKWIDDRNPNFEMPVA